MHTLRFRQVHLDFHTSPDIPGIGARFDKAQFQAALRLGHVDSITLFSKCHHGLSYHPTSVGKMHPGLSFNLLRAQIDAAKEIGVATPVYLSAGLDDVAAHAHPEWRTVNDKGQWLGWVAEPAKPGFRMMCFRTAYLDYLCDQIREACRLFPEANGIFLDIVDKRQCLCESCQRYMRDNGLALDNPADIDRAAEDTLRLYYERTTAAARELRPDMPVFHNSGNIGPRFREKGWLDFFSHLELESLPTGGWGYDHFPLSAKYVAGLGFDYLGMTGKFHGTWGEFGGFKHPNALRHECAAMLAFGAKCSVGDQPHPDCAMDESTYRLIGEAYAEVEAKEPWCRDVRNVADIGVLQECGLDGSTQSRPTAADTGAGRMLLESHFLFDMLDAASDFSPYRVLILPDAITIDDALKAKLDRYLAQGGRLLLTGASGLDADRRRFLFDVGAETYGPSPFAPDYILPREGLRSSWLSTPLVMHPVDTIPGGGSSQRLRVTDGESLGDIFDPYFNRTWEHYCSHQHTPNRPEPSGFVCGVRKGAVAYLAHPVFSLYARKGMVAVRDYAMGVLRQLLGAPTVEVDGLPSTGRVTLQDQAAESRKVLHLVWSPTSKRGGIDDKDVEVVEDLIPLRGISVTVRPGAPVKTVRLVPQGTPLPFETAADSAIRFTIPEILCHQMVELA
ncbi:MAG: beta-galactosidase trimerization domain-containing protein [Kiritimatiellae bacterium]|nr:beta-galactosidase trimerization domain-containing protein [Kiritimatiellia bacterium]